MLYAFKDGATIFVIAGDTKDNFDAFAANPPAPLSHIQEMSGFSVFLDDRLSGFKIAYMADYSDEAALQASIDPTVLTILPRPKALSEQNRMFRDTMDDMYEKGSAENRTFAEIFKLTEDDPWDRRTDAEKQADLDNKKAFDEAKKGGKLSGDSFSGAKKNDPTAKVWSTRGTEQADGSVTIDDAIAVKGLWNKPAHEVNRPWDDEFDDNIDIASIKANEFAFLVGIGDMEHSVHISPIADFSYDQELMNYVAHLIPRQYFYESSETIFEAKQLSSGELRATMLTLGFLESQTLYDGMDVGAWIDPSTPVDHALVRQDVVDAPRTTPPAYVAPVMVDNPLRIVDSPFATLFRTDFVGITPSELQTLLDDNGINWQAMIVANGALPDGAWTAAGLERLANRIGDLVKDLRPELEIEVYAINAEGERLVPKGTVKVVDTNAEREIGPRKWNARKAEYRAMTKAQRLELRKEIRGDEFVYAGSYDPSTGVTVFIVPMSYFEKYGKLYPFKLEIDHLIPQGFKEVSPGRYVSRTANWNNASFDLGKRGIKEYMMLRLYLNTL